MFVGNKPCYMVGPSKAECAKALDQRRRARLREKPHSQRANHGTGRAQPPPAVRMMQGSGASPHRQPPCGIQSPTAAGRSPPQFRSPVTIAGPFAAPPRLPILATTLARSCSPCQSTRPQLARTYLGVIKLPFAAAR